MFLPMTVLGGQSNVNLSGTDPSPNQSLDARTTDPSGFTATAGWYWRSDGSVDKYTDGVLGEFNPTPDEWYDPNGSPPITYYIRATLNSGTAANQISSPTPVGNWVPLTSDVHLYFTYAASASETYFNSGEYFIEISPNSGGSPVIASGYYEWRISVSP